MANALSLRESVRSLAQEKIFDKPNKFCVVPLHTLPKVMAHGEASPAELLAASSRLFFRLREHPISGPRANVKGKWLAKRRLGGADTNHPLLEAP